MLLTDKTYIINNLLEKDILVDENDEPIIINGEKIYWTFIRFDKELKYHFIKGFLGTEKKIEIISIYSFDNEELREEKNNYKLICGGKKFDPTRPLMKLFSP